MQPRAENSTSRFLGEPLRVLIIPGLHDSGPRHWQTWLESQYAHTARVQQRDWQDPDIDAWARRIDETIASHGPHVSWIAVAHSFGCLALSAHLKLRRERGQGDGRGICSALMVAPADPFKFGIAHRLPQQGLGVPATVIASENDPWMRLAQAREWSNLWGARFQNLGRAGHINVESGFGPWPLARFKVDQMIRDQQRQRRLDRAHPMELSYAV